MELIDYSDNYGDELQKMPEEPNEKKKRKKRLHHYDDFNSDLINSPVYDEDLMDRIFKGIVQNIIFEMKRKNMSYSDLSNLSGISGSTLSKIFTYKVSLSIRTLVKIAYALEVPIATLFPMDFNERKTNGQIFDDLTRSLDIQSLNYLLDITSKFVALENNKNK